MSQGKSTRTSLALITTVSLTALCAFAPPALAQRPPPAGGSAELVLQAQPGIARVATAGDILVVEIDGSKYRSWSIGTNSNVGTAPAWKPILGPIMVGQKPTLTIDVTNARGAYISQVGTGAPQLSVRITGQMATNSGQQSYATPTPSGFDSAEWAGAPSGAIPDAPMAYLRNNHGTMTDLRLGNATALLAFHNGAVLAARSMHSQVATTNATFALAASVKVNDAVSRATPLRTQAIDLAKLTGVGGDGRPSGQLIKAYGDQLLAKAQADSAAAQQSAAQLPQKIPDAKVLMSPCFNQGQTMLTAANAAMDTIEAKYPESGTWDGGEDNSNDGLDERLRSNALENCVLNAEGSVPQFDESNAPIPTIAEADHRQIGTDVEVFALDIETKANLFETNNDTDATEAQYSLAVADTLAFEKQLLATLVPVDTTGSVNDEQSSLDGVVSVVNPDSARQVGAGDVRMAAAGASVQSGDSCKAADFDFNMIGAGLVLGTPWQDKMTGSPSVDVMIGLAGADCIYGKGGVDLILGMAGDDRIYGEDHHDFLFGGKGNDTIEAGKGKAYIVTIGTVTIKAWLGNLVSGGAGKDKIYGIAKDEKGEPGYVDFLFGDGLAKTANAGGDAIDGNGGIDFSFGQAGDDELSSNGKGKIEINGTEIAMGSFFFGGGGDDKVKGSPNTDFFFGAPGNDSGNMDDDIDFVFGGPGNEKVSGDKGFDILFGGLGDDRLEGGEGIGTGQVPLDAELIFGGKGKDTLLDKGGFSALGGLFFGGADDDIIRLGAGFNLLFGGPGGDLVVGGREFDLAFGGPDNDTVDGDMGIDLLFGGPGNDRVNGGGGVADLAFGGAGQDLMLGGSDITKIVGTDGIDLMFGNLESDYLDGQDGIDLVFGDGASDVVRGGNGIDLVFGMVGNDCVYGDDDIDFVLGGAEDDKVFGGKGIDLVMGNAGIDDLFGDEAINLVISDTEGEKIDLGGGGLALGGGGNDDIFGDGTSIAIGSGGDDRIELKGAVGVAFGGDGPDQIMVPDYSISGGGAAADRIAGGAIAVGGAGPGEIMDARIAFGGDDNDKVQTKTGLSVVFAGQGNDQVTQGSGGDLVFGGGDNDAIQVPDGRSLVFGQGGDDAVDVLGAEGETRDFVFGGGGSDTVQRNDPPKKDAIFSASAGSVSAPSAPTALTTPLALRAERPCPVPDSIKGFAASVRGGVGSTLQLAKDIHDYPDKNDTVKPPAKK